MVLTDEEKRQSLMKKTQDNRVEKNKADTDDLNNIELLLKTIKKLENKLSSAVEMPVSVQTDSEEVFAPWTEATNELDLVCDEMFDIDVKLKVVHLYGYSSAFPHTRTRTAFPSVM